MVTRVLTINTGSSSLKATLYRLGATERVDISATAERIGLPGGRVQIADANGVTLLDQPCDLHDHDAPLETLIAWMRERRLDLDIDAVGHRVVHGGSKYREPQLITTELVKALKELIPIDPNHLPQALDSIRVAHRAFPATPQVACFDTAFHRQMPRVAQLFALPRELTDAGLVRLGFHGLSYEYIVKELWIIDPGAVEGRVIIAHLGNGASMAAVRAGIGVDTTMGFTPIGGLMMSTRSGDLDPGVLVYLVQSRGMHRDALSRLVNQNAGLLGVSGVSADMQDLLSKEESDAGAAEAINLFCYQARKFLGALAAVLGGLDTLVFTAGIGEHAAPVRERICAGLNYLGIELDP
ncbi:MAG TPA: acetate/propionate family kinase, partial [Thermoanaerobaculia bacterium]|nr:acetate/propionate family kinase [Thermoanaerobaculia bacterium]